MNDSSDNPNAHAATPTVRVLGAALPFSFRGRQPTRANGKLRRQAILEATQRIIVREGIQGVRHRTVAEEAEVPLSATTYYFNDINDLVHDAFLYFSQCSAARAASLEDNGRRILESLSGVGKVGEQARRILGGALGQLIIQHIKVQVEDRDSRIMEQVFRAEALRNQALADALSIPDQMHLEAIAHYMSVIGAQEPDVIAGQLLALIHHMQNACLLRTLSQNEMERQTSLAISRLVKSINLEKY